jgi:hypothetical protein
MVLDELVEIVTKYRNSSDILIGGDVNASKGKCGCQYFILLTF